MQVRVIGANIDVGDSLNSHIEEQLIKTVKKYFENAVSAEVHFHKEGLMFHSMLFVNEGVKKGIVVKSDGEAGDAYSAFNEALRKAHNQLQRYRSRLKNYRQKGGGLKSVEPNLKALNATKYVIPAIPHDIIEEIENDNDIANISNDHINSNHKIIAEKTTEIEELSVDEAIMKMDLQNLPALVFINNVDKNINVVYHRKDGNISWINPNK
ncbi:MAG: ribosome hibernation-promoting factor, HPF/YfiA family [Alphaproteobacteria bacterium]